MNKSSKSSLLSSTLFLFLLLSFILFVIADNINPDITILHPTNTSYNTSSIGFNWTLVEANASWCAYSVDSQVNITTIFSPNNLSQAEYFYTPLLGSPSGISIIGNYTYIPGPSRRELSIVNITNISDISRVSEEILYHELNGVSSVFAVGNYVYLTASNNRSLTIINVTDPKNPVKISSISNGTSLIGAKSVYVSGSYAYVLSEGSSNSLFTIINVTDPTNPEQVGYLKDTSVIVDGNVYVSGNYAYLPYYDVTSECNPPPSCAPEIIFGGMRIINVTNVSNPSEVADFVDTSDFTKHVRPQTVVVEGDYAYLDYIGGDNGGIPAHGSFAVINISDPASPTELAYVINDTSLAGGSSNPDSIYIKENFLYFVSSASDAYLTVFDVSNKSNPEQVGYFKNTSSLTKAYGVVVKGDYAYIPSYDKESLTVINVTKYHKNTTISLSEGGHKIDLYCNDTSGNSNHTNVSFLVDTIAPTLNIVYPADYQGFNTNTGININFSRSDANLNTCWWSNVSGNVNITLSDASADNITVGEAGDGTYEVDVWCNDTVNHVTKKSINYQISATSPAITLNHPKNGKWLSNGTNINFNVTAIDGTGLNSCDLWGNWSGVWEYNQTNNSGLSSGVEHNLTNNLQDGYFSYNFNCTDESSNSGWGAINFSFGVDTIFPEIENILVTTADNSQTITFSHDITETNQDSCWYSIFNSSGDIDGTNENVSVTCGQSGKSTTVTNYASFNLTIYANDSAGNENSTTTSFTTSLVAVGGGGTGGGPSPEVVTVIAIKRPPGYEGLLSSVQRARIYTIFRDHFKNESLPLLALVEPESKTYLINLLRNIGIDLTSEELDLFLSVYNDKEFEEIQVKLADAQKFDLYKATLEIIADPFIITPKRLDTFWFIFQNRQLNRIVRGNKQISSCEVVEGEIGWSCEPKNSSAIISYNLPLFPPTFNSKSLIASVSYTSDNGEVVFQDVNIRAVSKQFLITLLVMGGVIIVPVYIFRKRITKQAKKIFKQIK